MVTPHVIPCLRCETIQLLVCTGPKLWVVIKDRAKLIPRLSNDRHQIMRVRSFSTTDDYLWQLFLSRVASLFTFAPLSILVKRYTWHSIWTSPRVLDVWNLKADLLILHQKIFEIFRTFSWAPRYWPSHNWRWQASLARWCSSPQAGPLDRTCLGWCKFLTTLRKPAQ